LLGENLSSLDSLDDSGVFPDLITIDLAHVWGFDKVKEEEIGNLREHG
jgi:hypothetical protein